MRAARSSLSSVFGPVRAPSTFEETVERLGTAIRLGLLAPGSRLPPERELAGRMGISRSTLRQALTTLVQSGHLVALRGRGGGTFVAAEPPLAEGHRLSLEGEHRDLLDFRVAVETGAVILAAERAGEGALASLDAAVAAMAGSLADFPAFRRADVGFHLRLAEAAGSPRLVAAMTEVQSAMSELIAHIPHPPQALERSNAQHARLARLLRRGDAEGAVRLVREHVEGTEHLLAGLLLP